jgi:hypothetical protein
VRSEGRKEPGGARGEVGQFSPTQHSPSQEVGGHEEGPWKGDLRGSPGASLADLRIFLLSLGLVRQMQ